MPDAAVRLTAAWLPVGEDVRFCVSRVPRAGPVRGTVVHAPAFAEEMNKSRHVVAAGARALAAQGYAVLVVDPLGTGDSPGDFGDATFTRWVDDIVGAASTAHAMHGGMLWLWGLRAGALLAAAALRGLPASTSLLLWQPVLSGRQHLAQFLRVATAGAAMAGGDRGAVTPPRERLRRGEAVEVGGYVISPGLAAGLDEAVLEVPSGYTGRIAWLEVSSAPDARPTPALGPAAQTAVERLRARGVDLHARSIAGPSFWQATELEDCPALVAATIECTAEVRDARATAVL